MSAAAPQNPPGKVTGFSWANPTLEGKADPELVHGELELIRKTVGGPDGSLLPDAVVEFAKTHPKSELHKLFPWDDAVAAAAHRAEIARNVIRSIRIIYSKAKDEPMRVYVRPTESKGYQPLVDMPNRGAGAVLALKAQALADLLSWLKRYEQVVGFLPGVRTHLDKAIASLRENIES